MSGMKISRRDLLKWGVGATVSTALMESVGQMLHVPGWHHLLGGSHLPNPHWAVKDSFELTRHLGRLGASGQLATLFQLQEAMAQSADDEWSLVTIKVFDQVHHPLVFALGRIENGNVTSSSLNNNLHPATNMCSNATADYLATQGIKNLATEKRFADLRFNQWFAKILQYGTFDGKPKTDATAKTLGYSDYIGSFPDNVAIQVGLGVQPIPGYSVHQLGLGKLRQELSDLAHMAAYKGLVKSPLGITCLMMGQEYDHNGSVPVNQVYNGLNLQNKDSAEVVGRNLQSLVRNIDQSLNDGFGDYRSVKDGKNLTYLFDKLSVSSPQRRKALLDSREAVRQAISDMNVLAQRELQPLFTPANEAEFGMYGNKQALFVQNRSDYDVVAARHEFVAQCAFVAKALSITGRPYRNFSLFLNVNDLDGRQIDDPRNPSLSFRANSLNYVEGMRQLAMGLNILAKAMAGKKVIVVVVADGGRTRNMGDGSGAGFAMMMGPKGPGLLDDAVHQNSEVFSSTDYNPNSVLQNLGGRTTGLGWSTSTSAYGLFESTGRPSNAGEQTNMGDWQVGVLDFLNSVQGKSVMSSDFGRFVRFKRG